MFKKLFVSCLVLSIVPAVVGAKESSKNRKPSGTDEAYACQSSTSKNKYYINIGSAPSIVAHSEGGQEFFKATSDLIVEKGKPRLEGRGRKSIQAILISSPGDYMGNTRPLFEIEVERTASSRKGFVSRIIQVDGKVMDGMAQESEKAKDLNEENISCGLMEI